MNKPRRNSLIVTAAGDVINTWPTHPKTLREHLADRAANGDNYPGEFIVRLPRRLIYSNYASFPRFIPADLRRIN